MSLEPEMEARNNLSYTTVTSPANGTVGTLPFREVEDAMAQLQSANRRISIDQQQIEALTEAVRKTELLMRHTSTDYLQVLTARQDLLNAEQQLVQDKFEAIQATINLFHAIGGSLGENQYFCGMMTLLKYLRTWLLTNLIVLCHKIIVY